MAHQDSHTTDPAPATLNALLAARALRQPDDLAYAFLADGETVKDRVSYAELDRQARRIAGLLRAEGIGPEPVLLLYPPGLDYIAAFFGCLYAGAVAVPAYPPHRSRSLERLRAIAADAGAGAVLCTKAVRASMERSFAEAPELQALRWLVTDVPATVEPYSDDDATPDRLAFLQYTSGSTSAPRGVMVTHGNVLHNSAVISQGFGLSPAVPCIGFTWLPLYHDMGMIGGVLQPMYIGKPTYLMAPATFLASPLRWLRAISRYRVSVSGGPNFAYDLCARKVTPEQKRQLDLSCWEVAYNGAEPVHADTLARFAASFAPCGFRPAAFYPCYGLAEATLMVTGGDRDRAPATVTISRTALERQNAAVVPEGAAGARTLVSCGAALGGQRLAIIHPETLTPCPPDRPGEVWVSGPSIAQGYWQRSEESEKTFRAYTAAGDGPFLRTGDLGFVHDGGLYVTGRIKDLIILRGRNHYPQDIENTVEQSHLALRPACGAAFAAEVEGGERLVIVYEVERNGRVVPVGEVASAVRRAVAEQHEVSVDAVVLLKPGSIPKTSSGKIQRHACKAGYLAGTLHVVGAWEAPADDDETTAETRHPTGPGADEIRTWLVERIARKLHVPAGTLDPREPLARYGLDSLTAVQLAGELEQWLGRPLSPVLVYDHPTVEALAQFLAGKAYPVSVQSPPAATGGPTDPIAVIGLGCRFPCADGPAAFWRLLRDGVDAIGEVPADRWDIDAYFSEDVTKPGTMNTRWGGFLKDVDRFDRAFFGIAPREAERMDPQQRLLLEVAWEALEDAGQDVDRLAGRPVGVFVGISSNDYGRLQGGDPAAIDAYVGTGNALSIAANRLSYAFDFRGPSLAIDTACSSSLVAVHLACQSLRRGESELAVAAGVNLILSPELTVNFTRAGMMAPDGRCKAFDASADGYVRSEGVGVVVLKPLSKAVADGDPVYAVVRGSAVNQDGRSNGLTAPNRPSQEAVLRAAYRDAGVAPADIDLVEAHGTGTSLGDPIEALALGSVLATGRPADRPALLGSVKTNIGHLEAAAGVAGFIKATLALKHGEAPPSLHFRKPNPHIPFADLPLRVVTETQPLPERDRPARAGVSSFGFGGTNAHVVLEAVASSVAGVCDPGIPASQRPATAPADRRPQLVPLSARSPEALRDMARTWADFLESQPGPALTDVAYTAGLRRTHHDHRLALVAESSREFAEQLRAWLDGTPRTGTSAGKRTPSRRPRVVFVFAGQGPQWWGMGRQLLDSEPSFRATVEKCDEVFGPLAGWSLVEELRSQNDPTRLDDTDRVQPVLFALQVGLAALWRSWGVEPAAVVGHSLGEAAAAYVAGALSLADAVRVVYDRSRLQHRASGHGKMAAVGLSAEESAAALRGYEGRLALAAINGPRATVWSGDPAALEEALLPLRQRDVFHRLLRGQIAFHSPQMDPLRGELVEALAGLTPRAAALPFSSTVTGQPHAGETLDAVYWGRNLREPVNFAAAADALIAAGFDTFLEVGPHPVLAESLQQCLRQRDKAGLVLASLRRGAGDRQTLLGALGSFYALGLTPAWGALFPTGGRVARLPTYPWQRERCWFEAAAVPAGRSGYHGNGDSHNGRAHVNGAALGHGQRPPGDEWLVWPTWAPIDPPAGAPALSGTWLVVADAPHTATRLQALLREGGAANVIVAGGGGFDPGDPEQFHRLLRASGPSAGELTGVLYLAALSAPPADALAPDALAAAQDRGVLGLLHLVQALAAHAAVPRVWVVTRGAQAIDPDEAAAVAQAPLWGLGRVLINEHPELRVTLADLDPTPSNGDWRALMAALGLEPGESQLAWRGGRLYAARLVSAAGEAQSVAPALRADATYLITGGLGGLGLQLAGWMVARGARSLVLTSRSGAGAAAEPAVAALRDAGAHVVAARADVTDAAQLAAVIADIDQGLPPLRGVVHAAGVLDDGIALQLDRARLWSVLAPKLLGAWHLHTLTAARKLDFFALFSSAAPLLGSPGQANYAAANAFLDALAAHRRARNLPAVSINWGPWAGAGMAARDGRAGRLAQSGIAPIDPAAGLELFGRLLAAPRPQVGVLPVDWTAWRRLAPGGRMSAFLAPLAGASGDQATAHAKPPSALNREALLGVPPDDWQPVLEGQLREQAARVLRLPAAALDVEQPLNNVGIDSLMAIELKNRIEADLGVTVPMVKFLEGPSVRELAEFLAAQLAPVLAQHRAALGSGNPPARAHGDDPAAGLDAHAAGHLLSKLDSLSDSQVDALLKELYAAEKGD
jgi:acyl transferase domain-containing protein/acyl-CoA synthetase (AMP-forming)/AMP-acid ligase II/acyl carrier protein